MRTLLFSSLYPSAERPLHGVFVEARLRELLKCGRVETRVVAPVPWFPSTSERWGEYARHARTPRREHINGVEVLHPRYALPPRVGMTIAPLSMALASLPTLRRLIRSGFDFDLIDAHYYYPDGVAATLLGALLGKPVTVTARGSDINLLPEFLGPRLWLRWAGRRARASIGVSAALVDRMRALGLDPARLHVMRNGVDLERFRPHDRAAARRELGIGGAPVLLTVGNLHEYKGQRIAVDALAWLRRDHPEARLLIVGAGPDEAALRARVDAAGLANAVRFVGTVPNAELARWYSAADLLVLASSREGWPNVLLESMACGTPVVASAVGGVPEIVAAPEAGIVVDQREAAEFGAAIKHLLEAPPARAAVRAYAERHGWEVTSRAQLALFDTLAAGDLRCAT
ncbi:MAG: glycosyltransferase family 4 protein [Burkholderiales bacterium]|nr:glycosyltransferase family 4 protein [Burkholderiales bacterium]MDE1925761.1 glycosyltransferase family 4 protein [Burkholderiales bacterium]MDE2504923.1 glycosyltransferase family 4 protein [Burkholderiales bacterium]